MNINELGELFNKDKIKYHEDYTLLEYDFYRYFINATKPTEIQCVGGYTNLDIFYASQDHNCKITNFDPGWPAAMIKETHKHFKKIFNRSNDYIWIRLPIESIEQLNQPIDMLTINAKEIELINDINNKKIIPKHLVIVHNSKFDLIPALLSLRKHYTWTCMTKSLVFFTNDIIDNWKNKLEKKKWFYKDTYFLH